MTLVRLLAPSGMVGTGFSEDTFQRALELDPDVIGCDAGSTDPGPYYLGSARSLASPEAAARDLRLMLRAGVERNIPVLVGSAGTSGADRGVDWTADIVRRLAREEGLSFEMATIYSEVERETLHDLAKKDRIRGLGGSPPLSEEQIGRLSRIVAQLGPEPYVEAMERGAQVVIAGRSSDASMFVAVPMMRGLAQGPAWHAAKILECGAGGVDQRLHPDCMFAWVESDKLRVEPPNPNMTCSPASVTSHFLYENADPFVLREPPGSLDVSDATYEQDGRGVVVRGSRFLPAEQYTLRLEAVEPVGYRRVCLGGIRDPLVLRQLWDFLDDATRSSEKKIKESLGLSSDRYTMNVRVYGANAVMREQEPAPEDIGHEVGVLLDVIADTPEASQAIIAVAWHTFLHHPIPEWTGLISNLAFPISPPDVDVGLTYRFAVNHVAEVEVPTELSRTTYETVGAR